jgi:UDP:flavonoid glycosyltransferase YjiC (YdhE family)
VGTRPVVAFFAMGGDGHVQRLRPLISALVERQVDAWVFTENRFAAGIRHEGGHFVDLFDGRAMSSVDDESRPMPCRYVSFAGHFADEISRQVAELRPSLVISDTFALIGRVVADELGIPHVNVCSGHNVDPDRFVALLESDPRVHVAPGLEKAVEILRDRYGMEDASPFSYVRGLSNALNVYCEPQEYLTAEERRVFDPVAFFGSLPSMGEIAAREQQPASPWFADENADVKLYISFGTIVWWSTPADPRFSTAADALAGMRAISGAIAARPEVSGLISLGGTDLDPEVTKALRQPNVMIASYVDQWQVLGQADIFVTHHGLNSTHESIFNRVPMLSYPFIWDQPALAEKCQSLGLAIPLAPTLRAPLDEELVHAAIDEYLSRRGDLDGAVAQAREWELHAIEERPTTVQRIIDLL